MAKDKSTYDCRFVRLLLGGLLVVGALALSPRPAEAFPDAGMVCDIENVSLSFVGAWGPLKQDFLEGAAFWDVIRKFRNGQANQKFFSSGEGNTHSVDRVDLGGFGFAQCPGVTTGYIEVDFDVGVDPLVPTMQDVASHEVGHLHGLYHTGTFDVIQGSASSAMETCNSNSVTKLSIDDWAHVADDQDNAVTANPSFENGKKFWAPRNGAVLAAQNSGGNEGPRRVKMTGPTGSYVQQRIRHSIPGDDGYKIRANVAHGISGLQGSVVIQLFARRVNYVGTGGCSPDDTGLPFTYFGDHQMKNPVNYPNGSAFQLVGTKVLSVYSAWAYNADFPLYRTATDQNWEAVDLVLRVRKNYSQQLLLDFTRIYEVAL